MMKESYNNPGPERRRFEISQDEITQERIGILKKIHEELKDELPEYSGITIFGSLSKGKKLNQENAAKSDIDMTIWIDEGLMEQQFEEGSRPEEMLKFLESFLKHGDKKRTELYDKKTAVSHYIEEKLRERLRDTQGHGDPSIVGFVGPDSFKKWLYNMKMSGGGHDPEYYWIYSKSAARLFHLGIGNKNKINKLRTKFLEMLKQENDGSELWKQIVGVLKEMEQFGHELTEHESKKLAFPPDDLDGAIKFYETGL